MSVMHSLKPGDTIKVSFPPIFPSWVGPGWRQFITPFNGKNLTIIDGPLTGETAFQSACPLEIKYSFFVKVKEIFSLISVDWIVFSNSKIPCNCPILQVMQQGCKNSNHI